MPGALSPDSINSPSVFSAFSYLRKEPLTRLAYSICDTSIIVFFFLLLLPKLGDFSWCIVWERIWPSSLGMVGVLTRGAAFGAIFGAIVLSARKDRTMPFLRTVNLTNRVFSVGGYLKPPSAF